MQNTLFVLAVLQFIQIICALNFDPTRHPNWHLLNFGTKCGESSTNRIIGGKNAALGQYPWIARIRMSGSQLLQQFGFTSVFVCGGVIINKLYILTAAHCVPSVNDGVIDMVRLGEHNVKKVIDCENKVCAPRVQDIKVDKVIKHKKYDYPYQFKNDICLLRLAKPIKFNEFVKPICPVYGPLMNKYHGGEVMDVAGWGLTNIETKETSTILKTLKITIFNAKACQKKFEGKAMIGNEQLCGGGIIGKDSCGGDSGGPLMKVYAQDGPPRYFLIGVVSFGAKVCAETDLPGVYLRVSYFMKWILDNIKV